MKHFFIFILAISVFWARPASALLAETGLQGIKIEEQFILERYEGNNLGLTDLIGYFFDYYVTDSLFFTAGTTWAISGNFGGYGTATLGLGANLELSESLHFTAKGMIGAGGHINIPAGGGILIMGRVGLKHRIVDNTFLLLQYGTLSYPNGNYEVNTLTFGLSYFYFLMT